MERNVKTYNQFIADSKNSLKYSNQVNELNKSTYNAAAAKAVERGELMLALTFLKHSNAMGIDHNDAIKGGLADKMKPEDPEYYNKLETIHESIQKRGSKWVVLSKKGKVLGTHDTKKKATKQLQAIEISKHG